jgi:hypothetical protein
LCFDYPQPNGVASLTYPYPVGRRRKRRLFWPAEGHRRVIFQGARYGGAAADRRTGDVPIARIGSSESIAQSVIGVRLSRLAPCWARPKPWLAAAGCSRACRLSSPTVPPATNCVRLSDSSKTARGRLSAVTALLGRHQAARGACDASWLTSKPVPDHAVAKLCDVHGKLYDAAAESMSEFFAKWRQIAKFRSRTRRARWASSRPIPSRRTNCSR